MKEIVLELKMIPACASTKEPISEDSNAVGHALPSVSPPEAISTLSDLMSESKVLRFGLDERALYKVWFCSAQSLLVQLPGKKRATGPTLINICILLFLFVYYNKGIYIYFFS